MKISILSQAKTLFIVFCCFASMTSVMSQPFSIFPSNTITDTADCADAPYQSTIYISNPRSTNLFLSYTVVTNTLPGNACWEYTFCDWYQCKSGLPSGTTNPPDPIYANDSSFMILDVTPNNNKGQGLFVLSIFETGNSSNSVTVTWNISGCLTGTPCGSGISEIINNNKVILFPNPAVDFINMELINNQSLKGSLEVYTMVGEKLIEYAGIKNNTLKLDLSTLPAGGYFIKYDDGEGTSVKKFFKTN